MILSLTWLIKIGYTESRVWFENECDVYTDLIDPNSDYLPEFIRLYANAELLKDTNGNIYNLTFDKIRDDPDMKKWLSNL